MSTQEKERAIQMVRRVYGAMIAAGVLAVIDLLQDTTEAMIVASKIAAGK